MTENFNADMREVGGRLAEREIIRRFAMSQATQILEGANFFERILLRPTVEKILNLRSIWKGKE